MSGLTTHVLDLTTGKPAEGLRLDFFKLGSEERKLWGTFFTNSDGRLDQSLLDKNDILSGWYEIIFFAGEYLKTYHQMTDKDLFLDQIPIRFQITNVNQHYHVPLLLSKYGYSTYKGS
jgi:5-hydroxyisourate hydrolase